MYTIDLVIDGEINLAFLKANSALLKSHNVSNNEELIRLWKSVYNADLILPKYIKFNNKSDYTMFVLKWS